MVGAVRSEVRKIFTTRLWWGMLIGTVVLGAAFSAGFAALVGRAGASDPNGGDGGVFAGTSVLSAQAVYSAGFLFAGMAALFPLALGVILITQEFRHKTFTATVLATPRRHVVVLSKVVAVVVVGVLYAVVYDLASVAGGAGVLAARGLDTYLTDPEVIKTLLLVMMAFVVWALLGFGFGILVRNQIAAVLIAVGVAFLLQLVLNIVFSILGWETVQKFVPGNLTNSMLVTTVGDQANVFSWWASALLLVAYALAMTVVGSTITARRDIT